MAHVCIHNDYPSCRLMSRSLSEGTPLHVVRVWVCACWCACLYLCVCVCLCEHTCVSVSTRVCVYYCVYVCACVRACVMNHRSKGVSFILPLRINTLIWYKVFLSLCLCECVGACYVFVCVCTHLWRKRVTFWLYVKLGCVYSSMRGKSYILTLCKTWVCVYSSMRGKSCILTV